MTSISHPATDRKAPALFRLKPRAMWRFLLTQPASFWFVNMYLFVEYVRPQAIFPVLAPVPWGKLSLGLAIAAFALEGKLPRLRTVAGSLLGLFVLVVLLSSFAAVDPGAAIDGWYLFFSWIMIYVLITNTVTTEKRVFIFLLAFLLYSFKMSQHGFRVWAMRGFSFADWGVAGPGGWFQNSGELAIQMCVFLPLSVEFAMAMRPHVGKWTRWLLYFVPITAIGTIVASSARGGLVGAATVGVWYVARSKHRVRGLIAVALVGVATWAVVPPEQKARFETAGEDQTSVNRTDRWKAGIQMANDNPVLGIGFNNWGVVYGPLSHNVFIQAWSELGYTGLLVFLGLIWATFRVNSKTRRLLKEVPTSTQFMTHMAYGLDGAVIGFIGSGFFVTVLYYPFFWINLAMTVALHAAASRERRRFVAAQRQGGNHVSRTERHATDPARN